MRDIVADADDLEIVGELEAEPGVLDAAADTEADFVIVSVRDPALADIHVQLLDQRPRARVLAVAGSGEDASLWELCPTRTLIGNISPQTLLGAIRKRDWRSVHVS